MGNGLSWRGKLSTYDRTYMNADARRNDFLLIIALQNKEMIENQNKLIKLMEQQLGIAQPAQKPPVR